MPSVAKGSIRLPHNHLLYEHVVFDIEQGAYYNHRNDIFLSDDDCDYYHLPKLTIKNREVIPMTTKTIQQLAEEVLAVQDACNLCGVAQAFARAMLDLSRHLNGQTDLIRNHPISRLWVDKLAHLAGIQNSSPSNKDFDEVIRLSQDKD